MTKSEIFIYTFNYNLFYKNNVKYFLYCEFCKNLNEIYYFVFNN